MHYVMPKKGRLRCKRPKSREETPKEGIGGKRVAALQYDARAAHKKQALLTYTPNLRQPVAQPFEIAISIEAGHGTSQSARDSFIARWRAKPSERVDHSETA
jgi:hypothetical protein